MRIGVENLRRAIAGIAPREDMDDADSRDGLDWPGDLSAQSTCGLRGG
jgi:hypothetical protein